MRERIAFYNCKQSTMDIRKRFHGYSLLWIFVLIIKTNATPVEMINNSITSSTNNRTAEYSVDSNPQIQDLNCEEDIVSEKEYVLLKNGSLLLPQNQHLYSYNSYVIRNETAFICVTVEEEEELKNKSAEVDYHFSKEFLSCGKILIEPHEFELMKNGTVYVDVYKKYYQLTDYYLQEKGVYVCIPNYGEMVANSTDLTVHNNEKFPVAFVYVSLVGLGISIIGLLLHLIVFCCVPKVRNLPGFCLASLSLSLLLAYLCFVSSSLVSEEQECAKLGLSVYYFFLTSFFWMNVIAFDIWRSFRVVMKELRISSHRVPWRRFLLYSAYSWVTPAVLVVLANVADTTDIFPEDFRPSFGSPKCWFGQRKALLVFFATPLCLVMALNAIFFLDSAYVINRATIKTTQHEKSMLTRRFFMFMRLALLMGLTWIMGIIAGYANQHFLWYIFVILNTLQGLFIFIVFSCSSKVRIFFLLKIKGRGNKRQGTSVRTISQASGAL